MSRYIRDAILLLSDIGGKAHTLQAYGRNEILRELGAMRDMGNGDMFDWLAELIQASAGGEGRSGKPPGGPTSRAVRQ